MNTFTFKEVIQREKEQLRQRRKKLNQEHGTPEQENWFGIAMSGGGIRSATINLGFLKTLNKFGILQNADYMSTVSGGGYTHAYVQATVKEKGDFSRLFTPEHIAAMRQHGEYLVPGRGFEKQANTLLLVVAFVVSWLMSLINLFIIGGVIYYIYLIVTGVLSKDPFELSDFFIEHDFDWWFMLIIGGVFLLHFLTNIILKFNLSVSIFFTRLETMLIVMGLQLYSWILITGFQGGEKLDWGESAGYAINMVLLIALGFFTNPNALSLHRYYTKRMVDLFLRFAGNFKNIVLKDIFNVASEKKIDFLAPYPLINTCLNLQNSDGSETFKGTKASDYFLFSPLFCGSKLTGYVPTDRYSDYREMTFPITIAVSATSENPGLKMSSNKLIKILMILFDKLWSIPMTVFDAPFGFWISNPLKLKKSRAIVWWPTYVFKELSGRTGLNNNVIHVSDGGHIENLGVYELLRRDCRLIIAVDAGEDKAYTFADLNNLLIRARNELGLEIRFRDNEQPEEIIRPISLQGYSKKRFAVADIYQWWEERKVIDRSTQREINAIVNFDKARKVGTFVYVKSSVRAPSGKPYLSEDEDPLKYGTYKYKIYHPDFPHESTSDQFFDEIQWESYFQLGRYIGAEVLGISDLEQYEVGAVPQISVEQQLAWFDDKEELFAPPITAAYRTQKG